MTEILGVLVLLGAMAVLFGAVMVAVLITDVVLRCWPDQTDW